MKVLLIRSAARNLLGAFAPIQCEPLELEYLLAACHEAGVTAQIYDAVTERRRLADVLAKFQPDAAMITGYLTQEKEMRLCAQTAKRVLPSCRVVLGGVHVQLNYERLKWDAVDILFRGENVRGLVRLLLKLEAGEPWQEISGVCLRTGRGWEETPYEPCPPSCLPLPERSAWREHAEHYRYLDLPRVALLKTAFSCPHTCSFCYGTLLHGGRYQAREVSDVLDELETIEAENVFIVDSDFLVEEKRLRRLLDGLRERKIRKTFVCYGRADFIASHPELMGELCRAGFLWYLVGVEAVDDRRLKGWNKGTSSAVNDACLGVLRRWGAECIALLIADLSFRAEDFHVLYRWVRERDLRYASVQVLTPLPGTALYQKREGELTERDFSHFTLARPVLRPEHMSERAFLRRYRLLLVRLYWFARRHGAYRFATIGWVLRALGKWRRWAKLLK